MLLQEVMVDISLEVDLEGEAPLHLEGEALLHLEVAGEEEGTIDFNLGMIDFNLVMSTVKDPGHGGQDHSSHRTDMDPLVVVTLGSLLNTLKAWRMSIRIIGTWKMKKLIILGVISLRWASLASQNLCWIYLTGIHLGRYLSQVTILSSVVITEQHSGILTLLHHPLILVIMSKEIQFIQSHSYQYMISCLNRLANNNLLYIHY